MNLRQRIGLLLAILLALAPVGTQGRAPGRGLTVYFFDVGQGDAALIVSPEGKTVLIDGGPPEVGPELARRVKRLVRGPLDLVILTHAHLDHLGGLGEVLQASGARRYMDPGFAHPSESYDKLLEVVAQRAQLMVRPEVDKDHPDRPLTVGLGGGATLTFLWPRRPVEPYLENTRSDVNANSVVVRLTYGRTAFLFTADAEEDTEQRLLLAPRTLPADVLKVAHHGSRHSSGPAFLKTVSPQVAIVSAGAGNEYGHPSAQTLERLHDVGAKVYRTDRDGEIRVTSDGRHVRAWTTPPRARQPPFAASRQSPVFHRARCPAVRGLAPALRVTYATREEALTRRQPAEDCQP